MSQSSGTPKKSQYVCPHCDRVIYNRLLKNCEFCGATLPTQLVYSDAEKDALKRKWTEEARRRRGGQAARDMSEAHNGYDPSNEGILPILPFDISGDSSTS